MKNASIKNEAWYMARLREDEDFILFDVPEKWRTPRVCLEAVKKDNHNFSLVPGELRTREICLEALRGKGKNYYVLPYIPKTLKDPEVWLAAVRNGLEIFEVPDELLTEEMCLEALPYEGDELWWGRNTFVFGNIPDRF
jgi:hypothetical protein